MPSLIAPRFSVASLTAAFLVITATAASTLPASAARSKPKPRPAASASKPKPKPRPSAASVAKAAVDQATKLIASKQYSDAESALLKAREAVTAGASAGETPAARQVDLALSNLYAAWSGDPDARKATPSLAIDALTNKAAVDARLSHAMAGADWDQLGDIHLAQGDADLAAAAYAQAASEYRLAGSPSSGNGKAGGTEVAPSAGNRDAAAESDRKRGTAYAFAGQYDKAIDAENAAMAAYKASGDQAGMARVWSSLSLAYLQQKQYAKAVDCAAQGLPLYDASHETRGKAELYFNAGIAHVGLNEYDKAVDALTAALPLFHAANNRVAEADTQAWLGHAYASMTGADARAKAIEHYSIALPVYQQIGADAAAARVLAERAQAHDASGHVGEASADYDALAKLYAAAGDKRREAACLSAIGIEELRLKANGPSRDAYAKALALYKAIGDQDGIARAYTGIGVADEAAEQYRPALDAYSHALPIYQDKGDRPNTAALLLNIGIAYDGLGEYRTAMSTYNQALPIFNELHDTQSAANVQAKIRDDLAMLLPGQ